MPQPTLPSRQPARGPPARGGSRHRRIGAGRVHSSRSRAARRGFAQRALPPFSGQRRASRRRRRSGIPRTHAGHAGGGRTAIECVRQAEAIRLGVRGIRGPQAGALHRDVRRPRHRQQRSRVLAGLAGGVQHPGESTFEMVRTKANCRPETHWSGRCMRGRSSTGSRNSPSPAAFRFGRKPPC